jgi:tryptophan synthase alpha chain
VIALEAALRSRLDRGGRAFVPYVTGGHPNVDASLLRELEEAGADAIEVGIPFSDPVMDGGVIQQASAEALAAGATPAEVLETIAASETSVPVAVMTYVNPVYRRGVSRFLDDVASARVAGVIVPDLPVDEADALLAAARDRSLAAVLLASPGTARPRLERIAAASSGFVYCVSTYGVTGVRESLADTAREVVEALRDLTALPLLVGVGVGTPEQAAAACGFADGVVVGSALMDAIVRGDRGAALELARLFRVAIPSG